MKINRTLILLLLSVTSAFYTFAQVEDEVYTNFEQNYNNLLQSYYIQTNEKRLNQRFGDLTYNNNRASEISDQTFQKRLKSIPSCVKLVYNSTVRSHIIYYTDRIGDRVGVMLGISKYYFPIFENILDSYGVPSELKYLVMIESAFNPRAVSRAGATGLWQFMYATARTYDLRINNVVDDRRDPIKSTIAAAKYLKDLYSIYNDWSLVLAAYNCGPGNVNKAIKRSGKHDFWEIYNYLPKETRNYVPAFIAATYIMNFASDHNIRPVDLSRPLDLINDTVNVRNDIYFGQIEKVMNISVAELRDLNPQYKQDYIPGTQDEYSLKLPLKYINDFIELEDSIANTDKAKYNPEIVSTNADSTESITEKVYVTKTIYHKVAKNDSWAKIARRYGVTVSQLRSWNKNIKTKRLKRGTMLAVRQKVAVEKKHYIAKEDNNESIVDNPITEADNENSQQEIVSVNAQNKKKTIKSNDINKNNKSHNDSKNKTKKSNNNKAKTHTIKSGETIGKIAKQYGISEAKLLKDNGLNKQSAKKIRPGQKLKISK